MQAELSLQLSATADGLDHGLGTIEHYCRERNVPEDSFTRIRLIVEELFSNTVKYGYGGECDRPIRLRVSAAPSVRLVYEDDAPQFDPTIWGVGAELDLPPDERHAGMTGIALVLGLSTRVTYEALPDGNRLVMEIAPAAGDDATI